MRHTFSVFPPHFEFLQSKRHLFYLTLYSWICKGRFSTIAVSFYMGWSSISIREGALPCPLITFPCSHELTHLPGNLGRLRSDLSWSLLEVSCLQSMRSTSLSPGHCSSTGKPDSSGGQVAGPEV